MQFARFAVLALALLAAPLAAEAQQLAGKVSRIGFLLEALRVADFLRPQTARSPKR
jgi:hypothetical protein